MENQTDIGRIRRENGVAGQYKLTAVDVEGGPVSFVGSVYGGPVVMISGKGAIQTFISDPGRFGEFDEDWVRRFFAA